MNDIFLSYASSDRSVAKKFADALESRGWSVWWDREIPIGENFDRVIEEELNAARCAVVLWSKESVRSRWVRAEASSAAGRGCLIPVLIEQALIPLEFTHIQAAELLNWNGETALPEFVRLVAAIEQTIANPLPNRVPIPPRRGRVAQGRFPALLIVIIVISIITGILGRNILRRVSPEIGQPNKTDSPSTSFPSASTTESGSQKPAPEATIPIKIGDRIPDGVPAQNAGVIETPHGQNAYTFTAAPGQTVYFRMLRHSAGMEQIRWRLVDSAGMEVFSTCLACGEVGVQILVKGGTYTLTVGGNGAATGTYELRLFNVPPPDRFSIKIGQKIADNTPGAGAATIENPGAEDIYTFDASPRQRVYSRVLQRSTGMDLIKWQLVDENGMEVFNSCLGCGETGVHTLIKGGTYTLTVGSKANPATGTYAIRLFDVPPAEQFSIKIGDRIRAGVPGAGAGIIETPGAEDIYSFVAVPGQKAFFRMVERSTGMDLNQWKLVDDNGMEIFSTCMGCSEPGLQTLIKGGEYKLIVGSMTNPSTGSYAVETGQR